MKKRLAALVLGVFSINAIGQTNIFPSTGSVGIGTVLPQATLHVNGGQMLNGSLTFASDQTAFFIKGPGNGGAIRIRSNIHSTNDRNVQFGNVDNNGSWNSYMIVEQNGNVGIGTATPNAKLAVNGDIRAREVKVENAIWPDYVFAKSYQLPTIQETEKHIKEKGHLQGIPSAAEVKTNGLDLGEMNALLLQKIEELTLYLIEQNKRMDVMQKNITILNSGK